ncbi:MAG: sulfatase [Candidatus Aminicenantes bacterium]|nr:sulfatase [Candidatus Aminicenantes bacterium]
MKRREFIKRVVIGGAGTAAAASALYVLPREKTRKKNNYNVLFIIADDLKPQLGCYGETQMVTPHIDRLASQGMVFERSYCQQALCAPSRASLLTGLRPDSTGIYDLNNPVQDKLPNHITLPAYFKQNGYETVSIGKIFHHHNDSPGAWSKPPYFIKGAEYVTAEGLRLVDENRKLNPTLKWAFGAPFEMADAPDNMYKDGKLTDYALKEMAGLKEKPFFLCVGYQKPHLPFVAPKKYWDLYDPAKIKLPANPFPPAKAPSYSLLDSQELRSFLGIPKEPGRPVPDDMARRLIHGYYACVSFLDAQVGRLMHQLETLHLKENTIVVFWGDNGWKLGTHGSWCKHSNFEDDTRVPLIVSVPGMKTAGKHTNALVESVDIYPTLCELCGLDLPAQPIEGTGFVPLLDNPNLEWKKAAFSQYPRGYLDKIDSLLMGYAMRTNQYRYVEWRKFKTGQLLERELYDHQTDPGENVNVIADPKYAAAIKELEQVMKPNASGGKKPFREKVS